ncbi:LAETG motif-containing sortase-dependent surface protein [Streptomyces sp. STR69]|uniref:LAETG motif-containing sortase-dependent surface protein n=1 Tax=Streptomyces sp. STR69 TaxID=1796942 RepID=UPI0021C6772A|nr:LAETG motif-containing sortase-dependent surface protein [Streptomyces sp. STR69]
MKLRRVMATVAATAAIAPLALLSAPAAFADGDSPDTSVTSPAAEDSSPAADASTPAADDSTPASDTSSPAADDSSPASDTSSPAADTSSPAASGTPSGSASPSPSASPSKPSGDFDPYADCKTFDVDEKLTASITGLPNKIVAGSGWHNFKFVVNNASDKDLQNVWINALTEYSDEVNDNASLLLGLAEIQLKQDGKWTDSYQQTVGSGSSQTTLSGSVVAVLPTLEKQSTTTLDLRVMIKPKAPAGSSFALSQAVYAGNGDSCYGNGDFYEFSVLAAGSSDPGDGEAKPTGQKPTGTDEDLKPQGGVNEATGNLAETGSSSALPVIGLVGGAAVVAGAAAVVMVRRRKTGESA